MDRKASKAAKNKGDVERKVSKRAKSKKAEKSKSIRPSEFTIDYGNQSHSKLQPNNLSGIGLLNQSKFEESQYTDSLVAEVYGQDPDYTR